MDKRNEIVEGALEEVRKGRPGSPHAARVCGWPRPDVPRAPRQEERAQNEERQRFFDQLCSFNQQYDVAINRSPAYPHARTHARHTRGCGCIAAAGRGAGGARTHRERRCVRRALKDIDTSTRVQCGAADCAPLHGLQLPAGLTLAGDVLVQGAYHGRPQAGSARALHHRAREPGLTARLDFLRVHAACASQRVASVVHMLLSGTTCPEARRQSRAGV
jgi:hypothetical protein